jgi:pyruvate formate lyase activating enzyme
VEARYYASFSGEGALNCADCHGTVEEPLPVSYCHIPHTGTYVQCNLCPHHCIIAAGERGTCRVRENRGGRLYSMVYGNPCAVHVDPIEKKPFYHFLPTVAAFSLATAGCSLRCLYCQNWDISQVPPEQTQNADLPPADVVYYARQQQAPVIAYTYSEPLVFYEYMLDTARLARERGLYNVVISAGFINPEPLRELCQAVDAIKIDLKGYDEDFYREVCEAELGPVLEAIRTVYESGIHLEIVNLVVPTLNDSLEQLRALAQWVARDLSPDVPLHFSRFHPQYKLTNLPPTPVETLDRAREVALEEGVRFVYVGNAPGHPGRHTYCPACGEILIARQGFAVPEYHLQDGVCAYCGEPIPGVWWPGEPEEQPVQVPPGPPDQ